MIKYFMIIFCSFILSGCTVADREAIQEAATTKNYCRANEEAKVSCKNGWSVRATRKRFIVYRKFVF